MSGGPTSANLGKGLMEGLRSASLLPSKGKCVLLSHSLGGHVALDLASSSVGEPSPPFSGIALMSPVCLSPHRGLGGPFFFPLGRFLGERVDHPLFGQAIRRGFDFTYKRFAGFGEATTEEEIAYTQRRVALLDFKKVADCVDNIRHNGKLSTFLSYAANDHLIEEKLFKELEVRLKPNSVLAFKDGGHNVQKSKAREITAALIEWLKQMNTQCSQNRSINNL